MNPYASDWTVPESPRDIVDRADRDQLAEEIRKFLNDESSAFEFDEALEPYHGSADPTVRFVTMSVWFFYDDCDDHQVALSKPAWNYFQRLLLLLESDRQVISSTTSRWSWTQLLAVASLIGFAGCIWQFGWGQHLLVFSIPFGVVSILISFVRQRQDVAAGPYDNVLTPFSSFAELASAYRSANTFTKQRYPEHLANRSIRSGVAEFGAQLQAYANWLLFSPIPLLFQTLPQSDTTTSIKSQP